MPAITATPARPSTIVPQSVKTGLTASPMAKQLPTVQTKSFPFRNPLPLRSDNWDEEHISPDHMHVLISGPKDTPLETVLKKPSIPVLCITGTLYREIRYIVEAHPNSECAMFLTLKRMDPNRPHFLAFDMFMPGQDVSGGSVSLDSDDCERYFKALSEVPYYKEKGLHRHICHLHSHGRNGVFWSGIDDIQQLTREDLGFMDDFRFYVVVNAAGGIKCSFVSYFPVLHRIDAAVVISFAESGHIQWLTKSRKKELDALMNDVMFSRSTLFAGDIPAQPEKYWQEFHSWNTLESSPPQCGTVKQKTGVTDKNTRKTAVVPEATEHHLIKSIQQLNKILGAYALSFREVEETLSPYSRTDFAREIGLDDKHQASDRLLAWLIDTLNNEIGDLFTPEQEGYSIENILGEYVGHMIDIMDGSSVKKNRFNYPSDDSVEYLSDIQNMDVSGITEHDSLEFQALVTNDLIAMFGYVEG